MYVLALEIDLRAVHCRSLKDKRQVVRPLIEGAHRRFGVSAAEVGDQDMLQRSRLGFAIVASTVSQAERVMDSVEGFVWSRPELEVLNCERTWLEHP